MNVITASAVEKLESPSAATSTVTTGLAGDGPTTSFSTEEVDEEDADGECMCFSQPIADIESPSN